jgi:ribose 5-phosphate isomerase RpiB
MRIAVVNEISTAARNPDVMTALEGRGHDVVNVGMRSAEGPELTVIHTSFLSALMLAAGRADIVVAGCGTGHGYEIAVSQYPGVQSGRILNALDAWLFTQINGGNVVSLALNLGYGWAGDENLRMIFDALFSVEVGAGYPAYRRTTQKESRGLVTQVSGITHRSMAEIVAALPDRVAVPALTFPGVREALDVPTIADAELRAALEARYAAIDAGTTSTPAEESGSPVAATT